LANSALKQLIKLLITVHCFLEYRRSETGKRFYNVSKFAIVRNIQGYAVAQLVEALHYKSESREFDSRLRVWNFSLN